MKIRKFNSTDLPAILDIYARSKLDELKFEDGVFDLVPLDLDPERLARFKESDAYVCEIGESIVGFSASNAASISFLFVHPKARGQVIAERLYENYGFTVVNE